MNKYFLFLVDIVGTQKKYDLLLRQLYKMEFYSTIPNDDNRGEDGIHLREVFLDKEGPQALPFIPKGGCTVLEMLIGLSYRLEFELAQSPFEKWPDEWFWILIDNLDLSNMTNDILAEPEQVLNVKYKITQMLDRTYTPSGDGGLFPLKAPKKDQRDVEIWYQMSSYVLENYPIV